MNRQLKVLNSVSDTTCFAEHEKRNKPCKKQDCRHWMNSSQYVNCVIVASNDGPKTLQDIGDMFQLTRMRICQIERSARDTIKKIMSPDH